MNRHGPRAVPSKWHCPHTRGGEPGLESAVFAIAEHRPLTGLLAVVLFFLIVTFFLIGQYRKENPLDA
jgi:hypothetical protein